MSFKVSYRKSFFRLLVAITVALCFSPSAVLAATDTHNTAAATVTIGAGTTTNNKQSITADDVTLENSGVIDFTGNSAVVANSQTGVTVNNNSGASILSSGIYALKGQSGTNFTLTNSGTITAGTNWGVDVNKSTGSTITNNAAGVISGQKWAINALHSSTSSLTLTNSGKIYTTGANTTVQLTDATGTTITNNSGGEIYRDTTASGTQPAVKIGPFATLTNSGQIRDDSSVGRGIQVVGSSTTVTNNSGGLIAGKVMISSGVTSMTLINSGTLKATSVGETAVLINGDNNTVILRD